MSVNTINTLDDFAKSLTSDKGKVKVVYFWADFHQACKEGGQMDTVINHLCSLHGAEANFLKVNAEELDEAAEKFGVSMVPSVVFLLNGNKLDIVEGAHPPEISTKLEKCLRHASLAAAKASNDSQPSTSGSSPPNPAGKAMDLKKLTTSSRVMLIMKGSPENPKCKFSRAIVEILKETGVQYGSFDILTNETVRADMKVFSKWPTFPQLYVDGEFVGGLDVVKELKESGELQEMLKPIVEAEAKPPLNERLKALVNQAKVMLFMKGVPSEPRCGFSAKIVNILREANIQFESFDILEDNDVRQGLKEFSKWPTFPQLYVDGTLIGGLDIVQEMAEEGDLASELGL